MKVHDMHSQILLDTKLCKRVTAICPRTRQLPERELPAVGDSALVRQFLQHPGVMLARDSRLDHVAQVPQHRHKRQLLVV